VTECAIKDYGVEIDSYLKTLEKEHSVTGFLERHQIQAIHRAKMIDWMVEVMATFKCTEQAFFISVSLMDRYFSSSKSSVPVDQLHISGISSMFLASKYEDIYPLLMKTVYSKIGHKKFPVKQLHDKEAEIMRALKFKVGAPTPLEFVERFSNELFKSHPLNKRILEVAKFILRSSIFDYELSQMKPSELAGGALYVAVKIVENQNSGNEILNYNKYMQLLKLSELQSADMVENSRKILKNAENFDKIYKGMNNLKTFFPVNISYRA
jgi:hypothetical protein